MALRSDCDLANLDVFGGHSVMPQNTTLHLLSGKCFEEETSMAFCSVTGPAPLTVY